MVSDQIAVGYVGNLDLRLRWKMSYANTDVTREEYDCVHQVFEEHLGRALVEGGGDREVSAYFVGEFTDDRTQHLQFCDFAYMTPALVRGLQMLLRRVYPDWRIVIWAHRLEDIVVIYAGATYLSHVVPDEALEGRVCEIAQRCAKADARLARERRARIARIQPFLAPAHSMASERRRRTYLVRVEVGWGKEDGLVRAWIVHPLDEDEFDLDDYDTIPKALHSERLFLAPGGSVEEAQGRKPPGSFLLVLWEFAVSDDGKIRFFKNGVSEELEY